MRLLLFLTTVILTLGIVDATPEPGVKTAYKKAAGKIKEFFKEDPNVADGWCTTIDDLPQAFCHVTVSSYTL